MGSVDVERKGYVHTLTLNRPDKRNALDREMVLGIDRALRAASDDAGCRCVVIQGAGGSFCSGRDLGLEPLADGLDWYFGWDGEYGEALNRLLSMKKPTVALVEGYAVAGGFTLAMSCQFVFAVESARFGALEMKNGFPAAINTAVLTHLLPRRRALELLLSADTFDAATLDRFGLITRLAPDAAALRAKAQTFVAALTDLDPRSVQMTLELHQLVEDMPLSHGVLVGKQMNSLLAAAGTIARGAARRKR
ncbi:MAG: enoyl-CoA hydratase/isomerase family protein [Betaproteobacteria bacterium]